MAINFLTATVEQLLTDHLRRPWQVRRARGMADFACHPAAILSGNGLDVFVKFSGAPDGRQQFEVELAGLADLTRLSGVQTPTPVGVFPTDGGHILVLEAVTEIERDVRAWREMGITLARIHAVPGPQFGYHREGYFGPLPQRNAPLADWPMFYGERRLRPALAMAVDSGNLPVQLARSIEGVIARLPELCGPAVEPALLHGDAQMNNFICTPSGVVVIDPAVFFGHPEVDLALIDYFESVPVAFFEGYRSMRAIDPGFPQRRPLWRLWGYLAAVTMEGAGYLGRLEEAVRQVEGGRRRARY